MTLFFCLSFIGCDNYCFVFISNPGGSASASTPSCQLNTSTGTVGLRITASPTPPADATPSPAIQHIFVTLRGIEALPSAILDNDSPDWRELAPKLAMKPAQLDLLAPTAHSCDQNQSQSQNTFAESAIPADAYRQIRLRLSSNQPATDEPVPEENACGIVGFNCVVTSDGKIRALVLDSISSQFQISSDHISGGYFRVLPDTPINLDIEFNTQASRLFPAATDEIEAVRLVPAFAVKPQTSCDSTTAPIQ
jgi:hypothetical protein